MYIIRVSLNKDNFCFKEIQGCGGCGEDGGGERRRAGKEVCRGNGGDAREENEIGEGNDILDK